MNTITLEKDHPTIVERLEQAIKEKRSLKETTMNSELDTWLLAYNRTIEDEYSSDERMLIGTLTLSMVSKAMHKAHLVKASH